MALWKWILGKRASPVVPSSRDAIPAEAEAASSVAVLEPQETPISEDPDAAGLHWWSPPFATHTELVVLERPQLSTEARALENLLVSHFDGHDLSLPPLLHVAETLLPKLSTMDCDLVEVASALGEDQVIAAAVLRMANSPLYRGLKKITSLRPAVTRLGIRSLRMLLMDESLRKATLGHKQVNKEWAERIWCRSLASACVMRALSKFSDTDPEDAFLTGLMHDIGNVMVLRIVCGAQRSVRYEIDTATFEYLCHECQQEFGELIADAVLVQRFLRYCAGPAIFGPLRFCPKHQPSRCPFYQ